MEMPEWQMAVFSKIWCPMKGGFRFEKKRELGDGPKGSSLR